VYYYRDLHTIMLLSLSPLLLLAAAAQASVLAIKSPKFTILSSEKAELRSEAITLDKKPAPLTLSPSDTLKLSFQVVEAESEKGVQPHQTFLRFYDEASGEEGIQPVRVTAGGKVKFDLNMARPPLSLPPTSTAPLKVTLILGSFVHSPAKIELFDLYLPASHAPSQHPDEASYHVLPTIKHTFRPEQKLPPKIISAVFTAVVVSPWVLLLALWIKITPSTPHLFSPSILPFTTLLAAFELLLFWYWVELKLGQVLLYGAILTVPTVFAGKQALASMGATRVGRR
jgi:oligosaccharyltransferase complex subunit delta (ribophorin II)